MTFDGGNKEERLARLDDGDKVRGSAWSNVDQVPIVRGSFHPAAAVVTGYRTSGFVFFADQGIQSPATLLPACAKESLRQAHEAFDQDGKSGRL